MDNQTDLVPHGNTPEQTRASTPTDWRRAGALQRPEQPDDFGVPDSESRKEMFALPPPPIRPRPDGTHAELGWPFVTAVADRHSYAHDRMWNEMRVFLKHSSRGINWALAFNVSIQPDTLDQQTIKAVVEEVRAEVEKIEKYPDIDLFKKS